MSFLSNFSYPDYLFSISARSKTPLFTCLFYKVTETFQEGSDQQHEGMMSSSSTEAPPGEIMPEHFALARRISGFLSRKTGAYGKICEVMTSS